MEKNCIHTLLIVFQNDYGICSLVWFVMCVIYDKIGTEKYKSLLISFTEQNMILQGCHFTGVTLLDI